MFFTFISIALLLGASVVLSYLYLLVVASIPPYRLPKRQEPRHRFAIAIPAHNEQSVIARTVASLQQLDYPQSLYEIHVVADHCSDATAEAARQAGAVAHERSDLPRGGKGAALRWLFARLLEPASPTSACDAVVVFDADTQVEPNFLRVMDARLTEGALVIQGQHRISNPDDGWFPALTWAMFLIDNRFQNWGRSNLGWSAKHMGDSICFRASILRRVGWGEGLTEDYALRQQLLLMGIKIKYEPGAIGYGQAAPNWAVARAQRTRWLRGTRDASQQFASQLWREALRQRDLSLLDGALQAYLPSYSTLTLIILAIWLLNIVFGAPTLLLAIWTLFLGLLVIYPWIALALEGAPLKAYLAILSGPVYIVWRTWLALVARFGRKQVQWIRTPHKAA